MSEKFAAGERSMSLWARILWVTDLWVRSLRVRNFHISLPKLFPRFRFRPGCQRFRLAPPQGSKLDENPSIGDAFREKKQAMNLTSKGVRRSTKTTISTAAGSRCNLFWTICPLYQVGSFQRSPGGRSHPQSVKPQRSHPPRVHLPQGSQPAHGPLNPQFTASTDYAAASHNVQNPHFPFTCTMHNIHSKTATEP